MSILDDIRQTVHDFAVNKLGFKSSYNPKTQKAPNFGTYAKQQLAGVGQRALPAVNLTNFQLPKPVQKIPLVGPVAQGIVSSPYNYLKSGYNFTQNPNLRTAAGLAGNAVNLAAFTVAPVAGARSGAQILKTQGVRSAIRPLVAQSALKFGTPAGLGAGLGAYGEGRTPTQVAQSTAASFIGATALGAGTPLVIHGIKKAISPEKTATAIADIVNKRSALGVKNRELQAVLDNVNRTPEGALKAIRNATAVYQTGNIGDVKSSNVLKFATEKYLPQFKNTDTVTQSKIWNYFLARKAGAPVGEVPVQLKTLDKVLTDESFKKIVRSSVEDRIGLQAKSTGDISEAQAAKDAAKVGGGVDALKPIPTKINTDKLNISGKGKARVNKLVESVKPELEKLRGGRLTNEEVVQAAKQSSVLTKVVTREQTEKTIAALTKARQAVAAGAEGKGITEDFINNLRVVSSQGTDIARKLQSFNIGADPELSSVKQEVVQKMLDLGVKTDKIIKASKGVNFNNQKEVTAFFRQFVKPSIGEILTEYRYNNLLSSPKTHIVNAFSNLIQGGVLAPATKLYSGAIDPIASALTGKPRQHYIAEVPAYYKGAFASLGEAITGFKNALQGNTFIERPDVARLSTNKLGPLSNVSRALEAGDIFFRTIIKAGEKEALATRYAKLGKDIAPEVIESEAAKKAAYYIFRGPVDPSNQTGQGAALSYIDKFTSAIYQLRRVPGVGWFVPFIQTPMNIVKQGLEYNPLGVVTLKGAADPTEQIAKSLIGSTVFAGAGWLALNGRTTWSAPIDPTLKAEFYASGRQPYSVKIGDNWVSYSRIGPLAYPLALAAAIKYEETDNPKALSTGQVEKIINILKDQGKFFSDQSYVQGIGDLVKTVQGEQGFNVGTNLANLGGQVLPLSSLQRWVAQLVDPVYRKAEDIPQAFAKNIPFLSKSVPAYTDPNGQPSTRNYPILNSVSPLQITKNTDNPYFNSRQQQLQINQLKNAIENKTMTLEQANKVVAQQGAGFGQGVERPKTTTAATPEETLAKQQAKIFTQQFPATATKGTIKKIKASKPKKLKVKKFKLPKIRSKKIKAPKLGKLAKAKKTKTFKFKVKKPKKIVLKSFA